MAMLRMMASPVMMFWAKWKGVGLILIILNMLTSGIELRGVGSIIVPKR